MGAFNEFISLVGRLTCDQLNRSENDLSSKLENALTSFGLHGVLDTGGGTNRVKRPDISLYADLAAADLGSAADILVECKKPHEVASYSSLADAVVSDWLWKEKFEPYVRAHAERVTYFVLTTFEQFLIMPIEEHLRRAIQTDGAYPDRPSRAAAIRRATSIDLRTAMGAANLRQWCAGHITPTALRAPAFSTLLDLRSLASVHDLETFASALADIVVGPEGQPTPGGALIKSIQLTAETLTDLPDAARQALIIYTMSAHGGMSVDEANAFLARHLQEQLAEFLSASIHSLVGRLFAIKTIEDAFCVNVDPPLIDRAHWVFHATRFDDLEQAELPHALFAALDELSGVNNPAVRDLATTGRFHDWIAPQVDPPSFRRLLALFHTHTFHDLDGDLLGRFFEIYAQRIDSRRRRELGQYYTPVPIVRCMWRLSLAIVRERGALNELLVLDPGVGSATFLIEGARQLQAQGIPRFWDKLNGFDIAPQVIAIAQVNLYLTILGLLDRESAEEVGTLELYPTDALDPRNGAKLRSIMNLLADPTIREYLARRVQLSEQVKRRARFPLVIGNPPYKNNSSRTLTQVAEVFPALLRSSRANARARQRQIRDDYAWFFAAADHYVTDRGLIAFVVSDSFCYGRSFRYFREDLLRRYHVRHLIHLGRFIFRDVGPRTSFIIVIVEKREAELGRADDTEQIPYRNMRGLANNHEADGGSPDDPRLLALAQDRLPDPVLHQPTRERDFALLPGDEAVTAVLKAPVPLSSTSPRRVFVKKWPGVITAFDQLFKDGDRLILATRMETFFALSAKTGRARESALDTLATQIGLNNDEERARLALLAKQATEQGLTYKPSNLRRVITGTAPNEDAWYPSSRMTAWLYYEPQLKAPRNVHEGRREGWGTMSQWREPQSHDITPKLVFTTSTNVDAGFKAFVLTDSWIVKLAAGTRQQLNYTGVDNPLAPPLLEGPNNLGSEAMQLYTSMAERRPNAEKRVIAEDFLLYVAGIYNSQMAEDYLSGGGGNVMHIPVDPRRLASEIVDRITTTSRHLRNLHWIESELEVNGRLRGQLAGQLSNESELASIGLSRTVPAGGKFRSGTAWILGDGTLELLSSAIAADNESLNADVARLFGGL